MSGKFGGGGTKCIICSKTAYPAEQVSFEKSIYHVECFRCTCCNKKTSSGKAELYEGKVYDRRCFTKAGFSHKTQTSSVWKPKKSSGTGSGKYGGGGVKCTLCSLTVYGGEKVSFDQKPYHAKCMKCTTCAKKIAAANASQFEGRIYCNLCFKKGGYSQKQTKVVWKKGSSNTGSTTSSGRWGGGGVKCFVCSKTVYQSEAVKYEGEVYHAKCMRCTSTGGGTRPVCGKLLGKLKDCNIYELKLYCPQCWVSDGLAKKQTEVKWTPKTGGSTTGSSKFGGGGEKCASCSKTVYAAEKVTFEKHIYHGSCLVCSICKKRSSASKLNMWKDDLVCAKCWEEGNYRAKQTATKKKDGSEKKAPTDSRFNKFGGGGEKCDVCKKTVYTAEKISYEKHIYHAKCFTCQNDGCGVKLKVGKANYQKHGDAISIYCQKCFTALGLNRAQLDTTTAGEATEEAPEATEEAPEATEEAPETPDTGDRPELD